MRRGCRTPRLMATEAWRSSRSWRLHRLLAGRSGQRGESLFGACLGMDGGKSAAGLNEYFVGRLPCQGFCQRENQRDSLRREVLSELYNAQNQCSCVRRHSVFSLSIFRYFARQGSQTHPPRQTASGRMGHPRHADWLATWQVNSRLLRLLQ